MSLQPSRRKGSQRTVDNKIATLVPGSEIPRGYVVAGQCGEQSPGSHPGDLAWN